MATSILSAFVELIGRDVEQAEVAGRIASGRRLVTVIGPGGVGKTSLATAVGHELAPTFALGAHLVDLSRIGRADAVGGALAAQLGFASFDALLQSPSDQPALVVVDNCEHVSDAAADAIARLLEHCAAPTVLATSRSPLDLPGESVVALGPLDVPAAGAVDTSASAIRFFCDRAGHAGVAIEADQLPLAAELCRRLDGLPLAIEIAAARLRSLALPDILELLAGGIGVLSRPRFRGASRHRSLRETIAWSYRLLDAESQAAFGRLGVCAGPFSLDLAAAVGFDHPVAATEVLDVLDRLIDASLLVVDRGPDGTRYRMLQTIRTVALEELDARDEGRAVRDRFVAETIRAVERISDAGRRRWGADLLPALLDRFDDIDTALRYCLDDDDEPSRSLQLYSALWGTVHQARVDEVVALGHLVTSRWPAATGPLGADAAATYAMATLLSGDTTRAVAIAEAALTAASASIFAGLALRRVLALVARADADHGRAAELLGEAVAIAEEADVPTLAMECEVYRAQDVAAAGDAEQALAMVRSVGAAARDATSVLNEIWAGTVEGALLVAADATGAMACVTATLAMAEAIDYPFGVTGNLQTLARGHLASGELDAAAAVVLRLFDAVGRSGAGDLRIALDLAGVVLHAGARPGAEDVLATAAAMPNTNPMVLGHLAIAVPVVAQGRVLPRSDAVRLARREVAEVAEGPSTAVPGPEPGVAEAVFRRIGDVWDVRFAGTGVHLKASKGMDDLAVLLARPGREVHCLELAAAGTEEPPAGPSIDETARRRYEARVRELQAEIDEADDANDLGRADRARVELDALVDHLTAALGLGGRTRKQGGTAARARSAVTHRLRSTMRRIAEVHPTLGRHLQASVTTGIYCCYQPERPVPWLV